MSPKAETKKPATTQATAVTVPQLNAAERIEAIILGSIENPERGVVCLVGPTQWGKTRLLWEIYTKRLGIAPENVIMVNPQNDLPEDIGGWPVKDGKTLSFTQPANIPPRLLDPSNYDSEGNPKVRWGIIVDELDKAQEQVLSCMLTFFNPDERRLRTTRISRKVPITAAMNEAEHRAMPDPLLARLLFLAFPPVGYDVSTRENLKPIAKIVREMYTTLPEVAFPTRPEAPGSAHKLAEWLDHPHFWVDTQFRTDIVRGLMNEKQTTFVLQRLQDRTPNATKAWALSADPVDVSENIIDLLNTGTYEARAEMIETLVGRARQEPTGEIARVLGILFDSSDTVVRIGMAGRAEEAKEIYRANLAGKNGG